MPEVLRHTAAIKCDVVGGVAVVVVVAAAAVKVCTLRTRSSRVNFYHYCYRFYQYLASAVICYNICFWLPYRSY